MITDSGLEIIVPVDTVVPTFSLRVVDQFILLELDYYQQTSTTIDLNSGSFQGTFLPPRFKNSDSSDLDIDDTSNPERTVYVKVLGHEDEDLDTFIRNFEFENERSLEAKLTFDNAPECVF